MVHKMTCKALLTSRGLCLANNVIPQHDKLSPYIASRTCKVTEDRSHCSAALLEPHAPQASSGLSAISSTRVTASCHK